jgi:3-hydroxyisobutyrate dehydrogenase-like beta-hydroxyacid dehydrogenase
LTRLGLIGFGELGAALGAAFAAAPGHRVSAWVRDPDRYAARLREAGVERAATIAEAADGADLVLSAVPASSSEAVLDAAAPHLGAGSVYVDLAAAPPEAKRRAAARVEGFADVAVLGTVAASGADVPLLASGPGARRFADVAAAAGLQVTVLEAPAGAAAEVKLVRSVYMKGRDALVAEMLVAARRLGIEQAVVGSIRGPGEEVPFPALAERTLTALGVHAARRADELEAAAGVLRSLGIEPVMARAAAERLRALGALRAGFAGERPSDAEAVLEAADRLLGGAPG